MNEINYTLYSVPMLLSRNKSIDYQLSVLKAATSLLLFLKNNKLLVDVEPFNSDGTLNQNIVIKKSDVTPDGLKLFSEVVDGWEKYLDKTTSNNKYKNISRLERGLEKIRASKE